MDVILLEFLLLTRHQQQCEYLESEDVDKGVSTRHGVTDDRSVYPGGGEHRLERELRPAVLYELWGGGGEGAGVNITIVVSSGGSFS